MRTTRLPDKIKIVNAVIPTAGAVATMTATVVDGTGFSRVAFVISTGAATATGTFDVKVQSSATSGGTYADVTNATITQMVAATGGSKQVVIDMPVDNAKMFMKLVAVVGTAAFANSALAILYRGTNYPIASTYAAEIVTL